MAPVSRTMAIDCLCLCLFGQQVATNSIVARSKDEIPNALLIFVWFLLVNEQTKTLILAALVASASAFTSPAMVSQSSTALFNHEPKLGAGGMADTRDPDPVVHEDPRKSISEAPSFEEYLKQRAAEQGN